MPSDSLGGHFFFIFICNPLNDNCLAFVETNNL